MTDISSVFTYVKDVKFNYLLHGLGYLAIPWVQEDVVRELLTNAVTVYLSAVLIPVP